MQIFFPGDESWSGSDKLARKPTEETTTPPFTQEEWESLPLLSPGAHGWKHMHTQSKYWHQ